MTTPIIIVHPTTVHVFADSIAEAQLAFTNWTDADEKTEPEAEAHAAAARAIFDVEIIGPKR